MVKLDATKNVLKVRTLEPLTSNSVNVNQAQFTFNSAWDGLSKTAVFRAGAVSISVVLDDNSCLIPWEVLQKAGAAVEVGVYGTLGEEIVLPTIWAEIGMVKEGAKPGENAQEPTPDVYQQFVASVKGDADRADAAAKDAKAAEDWARESREAAAASEMAARSSAEAASQSASASIQAADRAEDAAGTAVQAAEGAGRSAAKAEESAQKAEAASSETSQKITELDQAKLDKPSTPPSVGNVLKVLSVNDDGTFVCEWADDAEGVTDVLVNGTSIVVDGVAEVPKCGIDKYGLVKPTLGDNSGVTFANDTLYVVPAFNNVIDNRMAKNDFSSGPNNRHTLVPSHLDYAVKAAMCDGKGAAWTAEEQAAARDRMGLPGEWELIEECTISEEITSFARNTETDGTPYSFSAMVVRANFSGVSADLEYGSSVYRIKYSGLKGHDAKWYEYFNSRNIARTNSLWSLIDCTGKCPNAYAHIANNAGVSLATNSAGFMNTLGINTLCRSFEITSVMMDGIFPAGVKFTIWGVRA